MADREPHTADAVCQTSPASSRWPAGANDVRVRMEMDGPLLSLPEVISECNRKRERVPVLTPTENVRKAQRIASVATATHASRRSTC